MARATRPTPSPGASPGYEAWRRGVEAGLEGTSFDECLVSTTTDGLTIQPLYPDQVEAATVVPPRPGSTWQRHEELDLGATQNLEGALTSAIERGIRGLRLRSVSEERLTRLKDTIGDRELGLHPTGGADWDSGTIQVSTLAEERRGAGATLQVALALAGALEVLGSSGSDPAELEGPCAKLEFELGIDTDLFLSIATLRAVRLAWARLVAACGGSAGAQVVRIHARTSERSWTLRDPWVNLLRGTTGTFAAVVGGADSILTLPFDATLGRSDETAMRLASNTQALLEEEAHLDAVIDPAAGSGYVEALTVEVAREGWRLFQEIEALGGLGAARGVGWVDERVALQAATAAESVARRRHGIVGVSEFPSLDEEVLLREPAADPVEVLRLAEPFEQLRARSDAHRHETGSPPRAFLANIGAPAEFRPRASFTTNLLAVAGIEAIDNDGCADVAGALTAYADSGAKLCVICSSDERYLDCAVELAAGLSSKGATVLLAGLPGDKRQEWTAAGVDGFIHIGCDALSILEQLLQSAGVQA